MFDVWKQWVYVFKFQQFVTHDNFLLSANQWRALTNMHISTLHSKLSSSIILNSTNNNIEILHRET